MKVDIEVYVRTCLVCSQDEVQEKVPRGLLELLPVAERPSDSVTMDFITCLPNLEGVVTIYSNKNIVIKDSFTSHTI